MNKEEIIKYCLTLEYNYYRWKGWRGFSKRIDRTKLSINKVKINANSNLLLNLRGDYKNEFNI